MDLKNLMTLVYLWKEIVRYKISSGKKKPFKDYQGIFGETYIITNIKNKINSTIDWTQLKSTLGNGRVRGQLKNVQTKK